VTIALAVTLFCIGLVGSFFSGMLGIGGAVVKFPMLLYIPAALGVGSFTSHEVSGLTAVEVLITSLSGVIAFRGGQYLYKSLIVWMGSGVIIGSILGSLLSSSLSDTHINLIYGAFALLAALMMFIPRKAVPEGTSIPFNRPYAFILALVVGIASGIVGAGGGFLIVPIMLLLLHIPTRTAIASSLAITFLSAIGSSFGKIATGQVEWLPLSVLAVAAIIGAPFGAKAAKMLPVRVLQVMLAILLVCVATKIWIDLLT